MNFESGENISPSVEERNKFVDWVVSHIKSTSGVQAKTLLGTPSILEGIFYGEGYGAEIDQFARGHKAPPLVHQKGDSHKLALHTQSNPIDSLTILVTNMIHGMSAARIRAILNDPSKFLNALGQPSVQYSEGVSDLRSTIEAEAPSVVTEEKENKEKPTSLEEIKQVTATLWERFPWEEVFWEHPIQVKEMYEEAGLNVTVELFRPDNTDQRENYLVICQDKSFEPRGIVVPRYGMNIDPDFNQDLFTGLTADQVEGLKYSNMSVADFPEVQKETIIDYKTRRPRLKYWAVRKKGKMGVLEGV